MVEKNLASKSLMRTRLAIQNLVTNNLVMKTLMVILLWWMTFSEIIWRKWKSLSCKFWWWNMVMIHLVFKYKGLYQSADLLAGLAELGGGAAPQWSWNCQVRLVGAPKLLCVLYTTAPPKILTVRWPWLVCHIHKWHFSSTFLYSHFISTGQQKIINYHDPTV